MSSSLHQIHNSPPTPDSTPHISANPGVNPGIQPWGFKEIISYNRTRDVVKPGLNVKAWADSMYIPFGDTNRVRQELVNEVIR